MVEEADGIAEFPSFDGTAFRYHLLLLANDTIKVRMEDLTSKQQWCMAHSWSASRSVVLSS